MGVIHIDLDTEWGISRNFSGNATEIRIGGGDYTSSFTAGTDYEVEVGGTLYQLGPMDRVVHITGNSFDTTVPIFNDANNPHPNPFNLAAHTQLSLPTMTTMRIRVDLGGATGQIPLPTPTRSASPEYVPEEGRIDPNNP